MADYNSWSCLFFFHEGEGAMTKVIALFFGKGEEDDLSQGEDR